MLKLLNHFIFSENDRPNGIVYFVHFMMTILTHLAYRVNAKNEGVDRLGGGTGIRWAESGVEGAESGVVGAESGVEWTGSGGRGAGSGDRGGGESGKIGAGN